jgi:hypothetical protein
MTSAGGFAQYGKNAGERQICEAATVSTPIWSRAGGKNPCFPKEVKDPGVA